MNGDIKDDNDRNEKIQVPHARALRAHNGCEIAALHVDIAIYLQGRERVGEAADAVVAGAAAASSKMGSMNIGEHVLSFVELEIGVK